MCTFRHADRKDKEIDMDFAAKFIKMYLCSGDQKWVDRIKDNDPNSFVVQQVIMCPLFLTQFLIFTLVSEFLSIVCDLSVCDL